MTIHHRPLKTKGTFVRPTSMTKKTSKPTSENGRTAGQSCSDTEIVERYALELLRSGKATTLEQALALARTKSQM